jgi:hypothetical protein
MLMRSQIPIHGVGRLAEIWVRGARTWKEAMNQFAMLYEDRFTTPTNA